MKTNNQVIGGEKVLSFKKFNFQNNKLFNKYQEKYKEFHINYTIGGHCSLLAIVDDLLKGLSKVRMLIPSYTCVSIINTLKLRNVDYTFYKMQSDFSIDFQDIIRKCKNSTINAILVIDYMGLSQFKDIRENFLTLKITQNIKIIQDCVHSLCLPNYPIYGDYAYNSFRKILPLEGSLLLSKKPMNIKFDIGFNYKFIFFKRLGQILRYLHMKYNFFKVELILNCFVKAESHYNVDKIFKLHGIEKMIISRLDLISIYEKTKSYYSNLLEKYSSLTFNRFTDESYYPFGFFIQIKNRDEIRKLLSAMKIYCPVHWQLPNEIDKDEFAISYELAENSLTIPLIEIDDLKFKHISQSLFKIV